MLKEINIEGMSCGHCVMAVKKELAKLEIGSINVEIGSAKVEYDPDNVNEEKMIKAIEEAGYKVVTSEQENR